MLMIILTRCSLTGARPLLQAKEAILTIFTCMASIHDRENGNGRAVRNLLERAKRSQAFYLYTCTSAHTYTHTYAARWRGRSDRRQQPAPPAPAAASPLPPARPASDAWCSVNAEHPAHLLHLHLL